MVLCMQYIALNQLLNDDNVHVSPTNGKLVVFAEDIENMSKLDTDVLFNEVEQILKECSLYAHGDTIDNPSIVQAGLFLSKLNELKKKYN